MKKTFSYMIYIAAIVFAFSAVRPYWTKHWVGKEMENAAVYGTKHTIVETSQYLDAKMKEGGYRFKGEDFQIQKDEKRRVTITLVYKDEIHFFGKKLKDLQMVIEKRASEIKEVY